MGFFCMNCKCQKPTCETHWKALGCCDKCALVISITLFLLFWIEFVAYIQFIGVFNNASGVSCCGAITESSSNTPGAVCFENDFPEESSINSPKIPFIDINGSIFCTVNGKICDEWTTTVTNHTDFFDEDIDNPLVEYTIDMDFEKCLSQGGFSVNDICNDYVLTDASNEAIGNAVTWCYIAILFGLLTIILCICEFLGCFEDSEFCANKAVSLCMKACEVYFWLAIVIMAITVIENPAGNGYASNDLSDDNLAYKYLTNNCNYNTYDDDGDPPYGMEFIWTELTFDDVPDWLTSDGYNYFGYTGITLSIIEFSIFFWQVCCMKKKKDDAGGDGQTTTAIEMN